MTASAIGAALDGATVLVTGGAGFVGSTLAIELAHAIPSARVLAFDSLRRRGSELNLPRLKNAGVEFIHGDVRVADDLSFEGRDLHLLIDCSAEPSVLAGYAGAPADVVGSNLLGTLNCLELARRRRADVVFLSTSRVYPIAALNHIALDEQPTRFAIGPSQVQPGVSSAGISEAFQLDGVRSLYGATKLASELLLQEYGAMYGLRFVINRLGVVTGPGQMGKQEQGVFALWMARHYFGGELTYRGWGGAGKQVRDLLHVQDVWRMVSSQLTHWDQVNGRIYNVGGGTGVSLSLCETTRLCQDIVGRKIPIHSDLETHVSDVALYCTDYSRLTVDTGWRPTWEPPAILADMLEWLRREESQLAPIFTSRSQG
jgi:CDP-paratose 2-epimerase